MIILLISHFLLQTCNRTNNFTLTSISKCGSHCCRIFRRCPNPHSHRYFLKTSPCFTILITVLFLVYGLSHHVVWHQQGKHMNTCDWTKSWQLKILVVWNVTLSQGKYFAKFQRSWHLLNISNHLYDDTASQYTRLESSATVLQEPYKLATTYWSYDPTE